MRLKSLRLIRDKRRSKENEASANRFLKDKWRRSEAPAIRTRKMQSRLYRLTGMQELNLQTLNMCESIKTLRLAKVWRKARSNQRCREKTKQSAVSANLSGVIKLYQRAVRTDQETKRLVSAWKVKVRTSVRVVATDSVVRLNALRETGIGSYLFWKKA